MPNKSLTTPDNRLILHLNGINTPVNGTFSIDEHNRLWYWLNEPSAWRKKYDLPEKIAFEGAWKLNSNYDLELQIQKDSPRFLVTVPENTITLKGEIISCESDKLIFQIKSTQKNGSSTIKLLKLSGIWGSNDYNQIFFSVTKKDSPDILTFKGDWKLNSIQQITCIIEKTDLIKKTKHKNTLTFQGFWEINEEKRLTYIISKGTDSKFDFKAQIETPNVYPKKGVIKYRIGMGVRKPKTEHTKIISLYGIWKISRKLGLTFDMEYEKGRINTVTFGTEVNFNKNNTVEFNLNDSLGNPLGISVIYARKFLKQLDAELFTRLKTSQKESGVDVGVRIPF